MHERVMRIGSAGALSLFLGSCESMVLPDFDGGLLNPDIRFLRAGEVMNGVKCAMTEFMRERELQVYKERFEIVRDRRASLPPAAERAEHFKFLLLYESEYPKSYTSVADQIFRHTYHQSSGWVGGDNELSPYALHTSALGDDVRKKEQQVCNRLPQPGETSPIDPGKLRHWDIKKGCVLNSNYCPGQLGVVLWDYNAKDVSGIPSKLGGGGNCAPVPDYSRFALDRSQQASIDLTLKGSNQGTIFYSMIDANKLGPLKEIIAAGNKGTGAVFPAANFTAIGMTTFDMQAQMPQTLFQTPVKLSQDLSSTARVGAAAHNLASFAVAEFPKPGAEITAAPRVRTYTVKQEDKQAVIASAKRAKEQLEHHPLLKEPLENLNTKLIQEQETGKTIDITPEIRDIESKIDKASKPALEELRDTLNQHNASQPQRRRVEPKPDDLITRQEMEFIKTELSVDKQLLTGCGSNGVMPIDSKTDIDYLALKDMLLNVVAQQNEQVNYTGGPEVWLDQLNLTTSFEIILDLSAGTKHIFRFFPMVTPPQMGIKPDHTHTLKVTLHGQKKKGDPSNNLNLIKSCSQRLQLDDHSGAGVRRPNSSEDDFCASPRGRLLESIIEAVEQNKSASANSSSTGQ